MWKSYHRDSRTKPVEITMFDVAMGRIREEIVNIFFNHRWAVYAVMNMSKKIKFLEINKHGTSKDKLRIGSRVDLTHQNKARQPNRRRGGDCYLLLLLTFLLLIAVYFICLLLRRYYMRILLMSIAFFCEVSWVISHHLYWQNHTGCWGDSKAPHMGAFWFPPIVGIVIIPIKLNVSFCSLNFSSI